MANIMAQSAKDVDKNVLDCQNVEIGGHCAEQIACMHH